MTMEISGYFPKGKDDSLQFEIKLTHDLDGEVAAIMGWNTVDECFWEYELSNIHIGKFEILLGIKFPKKLIFFLGRRA